MLGVFSLLRCLGGAGVVRAMRPIAAHTEQLPSKWEPTVCLLVQGTPIQPPHTDTHMCARGMQFLVPKHEPYLVPPHDISTVLLAGNGAPLLNVDPPPQQVQMQREVGAITPVRTQSRARTAGLRVRGSATAMGSVTKGAGGRSASSDWPKLYVRHKTSLKFAVAKYQTLDGLAAHRVPFAYRVHRVYE